MSRPSAPLDASFLPGYKYNPAGLQRSESRYPKDHKIIGCEAGMKSIMQQEQEVRALQKALNLPQAPVLPTSLLRPADMPSFNSLLSSSTHQTRIVTETDLKTKTDSLYIHHLENPLHYSLNQTEQPYVNFHRTLSREVTPLSSSSLAQVPGGVSNTDPSSQRKYAIKDHYCHPSREKLCFRSSEINDSHLWRPGETAINCSCYDELYDTETRDCLKDSCNGSGKASLIDKIKEAQQVIEHQSEVIARAEHEISSLQRELKKIGLDKQMNEQEIKILRQERENCDEIKSQGTKKRRELLKRLNQLDQDFKELNISHNALLVESKKKEADLCQTELRLNTLEDRNNKLQQVNNKLLSDQKLAQQQRDKLLSDQKMLQTLKQQANRETVAAIQENKRLHDENATLTTRCTELHTQLWEQKTDHEILIRKLEELKMVYELKGNMVGLLEEEVKQQQETFNILYKEQEQAIKKNIEQKYINKESIYLHRIRKLSENKEMLQRKCQGLLQKQMDKISENTVLLNPGVLNSDGTIEEQTVSSVDHRQQVHQPRSDDSNLTVKVHDVESLKDELSQSHDEQTRTLEQLELLNEEHTRSLNENTNLNELLDYSHSVQAVLEKGVQDLSNSNEVLYGEVINLKENEKKSQSISDLQENLKQIKRKIGSLEADKCDLMSSLHELQQDRDLWNAEKKELMLSLDELDAENSELREHLKYSTNQVFSEALSGKFQVIKQELDKVHKTLRLKDEELEKQSSELYTKQEKLNKLNEENTHLKKSFADTASKTSARNLVVSTLRDQLKDQSLRTIELEHDLTYNKQQFEELNIRHSKLEMELCQSTPQAMRWINSERNDLEAERDLLKNLCTQGIVYSDSTATKLSLRRKSDGCLTRQISSHPAVHQGLFPKNDDRLHDINQENSKLRARLDELVLERDSVLQDSEDLMEGMQQLKEAFEDEIKSRLENQRINLENEGEVILEDA